MTDDSVDSSVVLSLISVSFKEMLTNRCCVKMVCVLVPAVVCLIRNSHK